MEKETQNETQKKDYLLGLRIAWPLFGITLLGGIALIVLGVIDLATTDEVANGVLSVVGGSLLFFASMCCLALALVMTNNYCKAKHNIPRNPFEDPGD
jgi:hypothetical protein